MALSSNTTLEPLDVIRRYKKAEHPQEPYFSSKSPYFSVSDIGKFHIGGGQPYGPTVNLGELVTGHLLKALGGGSPDSERILNTLSALHSMGRTLRDPSFSMQGNQQNLYHQELARQFGPTQRGLALGETGRIGSLLQALLGQSGVNVDIEAQRLQQEAAMRRLITEESKSRKAVYGQIPIVGQILGGALGD